VGVTKGRRNNVFNKKKKKKNYHQRFSVENKRGVNGDGGEGLEKGGGENRPRGKQGNMNYVGRKKEWRSKGGSGDTSDLLGGSPEREEVKNQKQKKKEERENDRWHRQAGQLGEGGGKEERKWGGKFEKWTREVF